jgi:hypothetical protein
MRRIVRMLSLHAVETTQHRYGPKANEPDQGRHQPQPLQPGSLRRPGRREPDSGSRSIRPHPYLIVGKAQLAQPELHERGQHSGGVARREHPGDHRIIFKR